MRAPTERSPHFNYQSTVSERAKSNYETHFIIRLRFVRAPCDAVGVCISNIHFPPAPRVHLCGRDTQCPHWLRRQCAKTLVFCESRFDFLQFRTALNALGNAHSMKILRIN
jgi:hypothetical protein